MWVEVDKRRDHRALAMGDTRYLSVAGFAQLERRASYVEGEAAQR